ncbi:anti-sigma factor domain-containing protein [Glaciibacter sp. 2TAF33]|uniref:anti-sigma factor n=1 Tax=Glaciibacter sp. 2TAF33 TaxID=3233015 RepID=UPI003F937F56
MSENEKKNPADLAGAYALDAVAAEERTAFEEYLAGSEQARIEAAELSDTAVALGLAAAPVQPSPGLKSSLMSRLAATPQLPPLSAPDVPVADAAPAVPEAGTAPAAQLAPAAPSADSERAASPASLPPTAPTAPTAPTGPGAPAANLAVPPAPSAAERRAEARWFRRPIGILVAAAAAVALFAGGVVAGQAFNTNQFEQQQAAGLAQINAADDVQRASTVTADGHQATLVWSGELGKSALLIDDLPALPGDQDYQLWYMNSAGAMSAGTFDSTGTGTVWRVLDGRMQAGDAVGLTVEPKGGSKQPTTDPLVAIQS